MKRVFNKINGSMSAICAKVMLAAAVMLVFGACTRDENIDADGNSNGAEAINISFAVPEADARTRAQSIAETYIETLWIGLFKTSGNSDIAAGDQLIKQWTVSNIPVSGNGNNASLSLPVLQSDTNFSNTGNYHLVGVANYRGVMASRNGAQPQLLSELLDGTATWQDFCAISIDTQSASAQSYPIMQGALITANNASGQMIYPETLGLHNNAGNNRIFDKSFLLSSADSKTGKLYLRRLLSNIRVEVTPDFSSNAEYSKVSVSNLRYAVVNCPKSVYLQERIVPERANGQLAAGDALSTSYRNYSPNVNDWTADGFYNTIDETEFIPVEGEYVKGSSEGTLIAFDYNRYENKHSGIAEKLSQYTDREAVSNGIFTALCPDGTSDNNFAPYFVLMADLVLEKSGQTPVSVTARYTIHEGYANNYQADRLDDRAGSKTQPGDTDYPARLRDFSCVRNTSYTYKVKITGVNSILVQVEQTTGGERNGVSGDVTDIIAHKALNSEETKEWTISLTNKQRKAIADKWLFITPYRAKISDDEWVSERIAFGYSDIIIPAGSPVRNDDTTFFDIEEHSDILANLADNQFYNWAQFYDETGEQSLGGIVEFANASDDEDDTTPHTYIIRVTENEYQKAYDGSSPTLTGGAQESTLDYDLDARALYFCIEELQVGKDGVSTYQKMYYLTQTSTDEREKLDEPEILRWSKPMYVGKEATIWWSSVANAGSYSLAYGSSSTEQSATADAEQTATITVPEDLDYGDTFDVEITANPLYTAEYRPSAPVTETLQAFTTAHTWTMKDQDGFSQLPSDGTVEDWQALSNTLAIKGQVKVSGEYIQLNAPGIESSTFKLTVPESGTLKVTYAGTNTNVRSLAIMADGGEEQLSASRVRSTSTVEEVFNLIVNDGPKDVYVYSPVSNSGGLRIYDIAYTKGAIASDKWDFSSEEWADVISDLTSEPESYDVTINGLRYVASGKTKTSTQGSEKAIQPNGKGTKTSRCFQFTALYSGKLTVRVSGAGSEDLTRNVAVVVGENDAKQEVGGYYDPKDIDFTINITEPTMIYIYPADNGLRFYSIEYSGGALR